MKSFQSTKLSVFESSGDRTVFIEGDFDNKSKTIISSYIQMNIIKAEQVGFYYKKDGIYQLSLAGGEFSGNGLRSFAKAILGNKISKIKIKFAGIKKLIICGISGVNITYCEIPFNKENLYRKVSSKYSVINFKGISFIVLMLIDSKIFNFEDKARDILINENFLNRNKAVGVIFVTNEDGIYKIDPVVYIRKMDSLMYERSCGSGSAACAIYLIKEGFIKNTKISIRQPSRELIDVIINFKNDKINSIFIEGKTKIIKNKLLININI